MSQKGLVSGNGIGSPESGEYLRLPEGAPGYAEMFTRYSIVENALTIMSRVPDVHPYTEQPEMADKFKLQGVSVKPQEALFTVDSQHDTAGGVVGTAPSTPPPSAATSFSPVNTENIDPQAIARDRINAIFASRGE